MRVEFHNAKYRQPENLPLTMLLEDFFNRDDVQAQLCSVAQHIIRNDGAVMQGYGMATLGLHRFLPTDTGDFDGDPHNMAGAVLLAVKGAQDDRTMPITQRQGLTSVARQMLLIVESNVNCALKKEILSLAERNPIITAQRR